MKNKEDYLKKITLLILELIKPHDEIPFIYCDGVFFKKIAGYNLTKKVLHQNFFPMKLAKFFWIVFL